MENKETWQCPDWLEKYRKHLESIHGGRTLEQLMNEHGQNMFNNPIGASFCISCINAVNILTRLHNEGMLK